MKVYITHYFFSDLPSVGFKQISYLTATEESYPNSIFFLGFSGSKKITEREIFDEMNEGKIIRFSSPLIVDKKTYLLIDSSGNIWATSDLLSIANKKLVEKTKFQIASVSKAIYSRIEAKLPKPQRRIQIN